MAKRKSPAKPGSQIPFRLKDDEYQEVLDWINAQDIVSDSIRFLIQMDVARNGGNAVNYQEEIPSSRSEGFIQKYLTREMDRLNRELGGEQVVEGANLGPFAQIQAQPTITANPGNDDLVSSIVTIPQEETDTLISAKELPGPDNTEELVPEASEEEEEERRRKAELTKTLALLEAQERAKLEELEKQEESKDISTKEETRQLAESEENANTPNNATPTVEDQQKQLEVAKRGIDPDAW